MRDNSPRLAFLMREAEVLSEADWDRYVADYKKRIGEPNEKGLMDVLQQSAFSAETYRDLFSLPFIKRDETIRGLNRTIDISERELIQSLQHCRPRVNLLAEIVKANGYELSSPQIEAISEAAQMGAKGYGLVVRRGVFTVDRFNEIVRTGTHKYARLNRRRLASEILAHNGICSILEFVSAHDEARAERIPLYAVLAKRGLVSGSELLDYLREGLDLLDADLEGTRIKRGTLNLFPMSFIKRHIFMPVDQTSTNLSVVVADPLYMSLCDVLAILSDRVILPLYASHGELIELINRVYPSIGAAEETIDIHVDTRRIPGPAHPRDRPGPASREQNKSDTGEKKENGKAQAEFASMLFEDETENNPTGASIAEATPETTYEILDAPTTTSTSTSSGRVDRLSAVQLVASIIEQAILTRSTDIHVEPLSTIVRVRYRIDGMLRQAIALPLEIREAMIARIKVLANMNVTERRRPQDGSFRLHVGDGIFDFRVSIIPSHLGEKAVIRVLDQRTVLKAMSELGMTEFQERSLQSWIIKPYGVILVTGPTGSGKSSTLYSCLNFLNDMERNIITIEDPVEYQLEGICQVQVDRVIDLTFAEGLRSALRQDPDTIMVGEIRDQETARIAMRAALSGHLVLSTLHTNNAAGAITALKNMGVKPYVIAGAMIGIVAQRLTRTLCVECRREEPAQESLLRDLGIRPAADPNMAPRFWRAMGCEACLDSGYVGRTGVFEMLVVDEILRELIATEARESELLAAAKKVGLTTLMDSALQKVFAGQTTPDEILRTIMLT